MARHHESHVKAFDTLIAPVSVEVGLDGADDCIIVTSYSSFKHRATQCRTRFAFTLALLAFHVYLDPRTEATSRPRNYTHTHVIFKKLYLASWLIKQSHRHF